ncbi:MAG: oxidoreductase [Microthrixaceae bacterium]
MSSFGGRRLKDRWDVADIPDQRGRVVVVTGANAGLGFATASQLAASGATVVLAVRNPERGEAAIAEMRAAVPGADLALQQVDLASLDSIRAATRQLRSSHPRIDVLINNAGVVFTQRTLTADGFELQFGTNHLGHFALTAGLIGSMLDVEGSRVVTIASLGHWFPFHFDLDHVRCERGYNRFAAYTRSKVANLLFTYELNRRLRSAGAPTISVAAHPGNSDTAIADHLPGMEFMHRHFSALAQPAASGMLPALRAATDPTVGGGQYLGPDRLAETRGHPIVVRSSSRTQDRALMARLWELSEEWTGIPFDLCGNTDAIDGRVPGTGAEPLGR